jgi:hypothetical protein
MKVASYERYCNHDAIALAAAKDNLLKSREGADAKMHGWGDMLVALLPDGITGFRIGNGGTRSLEAIRAANRIRPFDQDQ